MVAAVCAARSGAALIPVFIFQDFRCSAHPGSEQLLGEVLGTTPFGRQERDFLPRRLRSEIGHLPLSETGRPEARIGKGRRSWAFSARLYHVGRKRECVVGATGIEPVTPTMSR